MYITHIAFRNEMDLATNELAKKVFLFLKRRFDNKLALKGTARFKDYTTEGFKAPITVDIIMDRESMSMPFVCNSDYSSMQSAMLYIKDPKNYISQDRKIRIDIIFSTTFNESNLDELYQTLVERIRHELQHMVDDDNNLPFKTGLKTDYDIAALRSKNIIDSFDDRSKYVLSFAEQEPFIRGMMLSAKKQHIPFMKIVEDLIDNQLFASKELNRKAIYNKYGDLVVNHRIELIRNTYWQRAKSIFPNLDKTEDTKRKYDSEMST